jgi:hypothetical protein
MSTADEVRASRERSTRRPEFAGEPTNGVRLQRIHSQCDFLDAVARAAFKRSHFKSAFAWRDASETHPVFAGRTHRSFNAENWITHNYPRHPHHKRVIVASSVRQPTLTKQFH